MSNWKVIPTIVLATVLIFGAGVFTGGLLISHVDRSHARPAARKPAAVAAGMVTNPVAVTATNDVPKQRPPEILSKRFLQQLDAELSLQPAQRDAISKIIEDGQNQIRKAVQDARLEIRDVLTLEQQKEFDDLMKHPFKKPIFTTNAPVLTLVPSNCPPSAASNGLGAKAPNN